MMPAGSKRQIPVDNPLVYAFHIAGEVTAEDMKAMATTMNAAFDIHPLVSMLLIFDHYEAADAGAGLNMETISSQFRALAKVDKYAVVGVPSAATTMIKVMDKIIPTDARTFEAAQEPDAWRFVGATQL